MGLTWQDVAESDRIANAILAGGGTPAEAWNAGKQYRESKKGTQSGGLATQAAGQLSGDQSLSNKYPNLFTTPSGANAPIGGGMIIDNGKTTYFSPSDLSSGSSLLAQQAAAQYSSGIPTGQNNTLAGQATSMLQGVQPTSTDLRFGSLSGSSSGIMASGGSSGGGVSGGSGGSTGGGGGAVGNGIIPTAAQSPYKQAMTDYIKSLTQGSSSGGGSATQSIMRPSYATNLGTQLAGYFQNQLGQGETVADVTQSPYIQALTAQNKTALEDATNMLNRRRGALGTYFHTETGAQQNKLVQNSLQDLNTNIAGYIENLKNRKMQTAQSAVGLATDNPQYGFKTWYY